MLKKRLRQEDTEYIEKTAEKKAERRAKKKKPRMSVSGKSVFNLRKILRSAKK